VHGDEHDVTSLAMFNFAALLRSLNRFSEAEPLYRRAAEIRERLNGPEHQWTLRVWYELAEAYFDFGQPEKGAKLFRETLEKLSNKEVAVRVIHRGVGGINESDVSLAAASNGVVLGFHVRPTPEAREMAKRDKIDIQLYEIIYEAVDSVKKALEGLLEPEKREVVDGMAEVRDTFRVPKVGAIAGCYVTQGTIKRNAKVRVIRDQVVVYDGTVGSLRRFKDDAREVAQGFECGVGVANFDDVKVGDILEIYRIEQVTRTL
jgi:translation initiation factor IF-2